MKQEYRFAFIDATIIDQEERDQEGDLDAVLKKAIASRFDHTILPEDIDIEGDGGDDWVDFSAAIRFEATPETVKDEAWKLLQGESRSIEVFSIKDAANTVVLTEENYV